MPAVYDVTPLLPRAHRAPRRRRTVLLFLWIASLVAEVAAGFAVASLAVATGSVALVLLLVALGITVLAVLLAVGDFVRERRRGPADVRPLRAKPLDAGSRPPEHRLLAP